MDRLISLQTAIKHLKHRLYETAMNNDDLAGVFSEIADNRIETWIEELPTAGSEIIRCKDCIKWQTIDCPFFSRYITVMPNEEQYCSLAERRTDE